MQFNLPLLFLENCKTLNLQKITFTDFLQSQPVSLIFKADNRQSLFHSLMFQKHKLRTFSQLLNFFNFALDSHKTSVVFWQINNFRVLDICNKIRLPGGIKRFPIFPKPQQIAFAWFSITPDSKMFFKGIVFSKSVGFETIWPGVPCVEVDVSTFY